MDVTRYRAKPGAAPRLDKRDPSDSAGVPSTKSAREAASGKIANRLDTLQEILYAERRHGVLIVLQGMDTAGKDGTIRHVFKAVDPLGVRAVSFRAPVGAELERDFLWRIHAEVPRRGEMVIFNRSHYEDVLVVRVHNIINKSECKRRYRAINEFEQLLAESGTQVLKFYLHISCDEQRERLQARVNDATKHWKFNPQDLTERKRWNDYMSAYEDAIAATSSATAPWHVIPANSKSTRNLVISTIIEQALQDLKMRYPQPTSDYSKIVVT